ASLTDVFDRMATAIFLIGPERRIIYANAAGEALLARNELVSRKDGLLQARHHPMITALFLALEPAETPDADGDSGGITLPLETGTGEPYAAHVLPLSSGLRRRVGAAHGAVAALFIRKAGVAWASPAELVANLYKLTPSEIRVLLAVVEHAGVRQVAKTLGSSEETVRSHLRHVFQKTGAKRQADLVKLLAAFASSPV
ncbi:MAG: helix-turn-helix transcriptional regulator, partial [Xanthobacteraceae bacterium]